MGDGPKRTGPGQPLPLRALLQKWSECVPSGSTRPDLDREFLSLTVSCAVHGWAQDHEEQSDALAGYLRWFFSGSLLCPVILYNCVDGHKRPAGRAGGQTCCWVVEAPTRRLLRFRTRARNPTNWRSSPTLPFSLSRGSWSPPEHHLAGL